MMESLLYSSFFHWGERLLYSQFTLQRYTAIDTFNIPDTRLSLISVFRWYLYYGNKDSLQNFLRCFLGWTWFQKCPKTLIKPRVFFWISKVTCSEALNTMLCNKIMWQYFFKMVYVVYMPECFFNENLYIDDKDINEKKKFGTVGNLRDSGAFHLPSIFFHNFYQ